MDQGGHAIREVEMLVEVEVQSLLLWRKFHLESNSTISANGGSGTSHYDGSGAGGSGGAIRIEASSITNLALFMPRRRCIGRQYTGRSRRRWSNCITFRWCHF